MRDAEWVGGKTWSGCWVSGRTRIQRKSRRVHFHWGALQVSPLFRALAKERWAQDAA